MTALERLKMIQHTFKQSWVGINTDYTGRPGTSNMTNSTRVFRDFPQLEEEELRTQLFIKILDTLKNLEAEMPLLISANVDPKSRTA